MRKALIYLLAISYLANSLFLTWDHNMNCVFFIGYALVCVLVGNEKFVNWVKETYLENRPRRILLYEASAMAAAALISVRYDLNIVSSLLLTACSCHILSVVATREILKERKRDFDPKENFDALCAVCITFPFFVVNVAVWCIVLTNVLGGSTIINLLLLHLFFAPIVPAFIIMAFLLIVCDLSSDNPSHNQRFCNIE